MKITKELNGALTLALRDFIKFRRDKIRIITSLIFPVLFIAVLGGSLQANIGKDAGYNFIVFTFTGVIGQTLFQSTASGIISLIEDRENDFAQEIFVSPISRYTIIIGKILGETLVSYAQVIGIFTLGLLLTIPLGLTQLSSMIIAGLACTFLGGAFGVLVLANLGSQRSANQIFPFLIFPQFFLAGVFNPIKELPQALFILSRLAPMTYAVDLMRGVYYAGLPEFDKIVLHSPAYNLVVMAVFFAIFILLGTHLFIKNEKNR